MAATIVKKSPGSGFSTYVIGSDRAGEPTNKVHIVEVTIDDAAYNGLGAAAKGDIDAVTIANLIAAAFN